jgi:Cys-tRNA(Pro)/Cys-tRNA(Cys) deacylase
VNARPEDRADTAATRAAATSGLEHEVRVVEPSRSVDEAAGKLGIPPEKLLKTLVVRRGEDDFLLVLVPGPRQIAWPKLRAHLGVSRLSMPDAEAARDATGYERGTITPFGAAGDWPVLADASIVGGGLVSVGGGAPGVAILADADAMIAALGAEVIDLT